MKALSVIPVLILVALAQSGRAQPPGEGAARNPADPREPTAPATYQSPFAGYRPFATGTVGPWKDMNDEVARIGGWKAYAREVYEASKPAAPADGAPKPSPAPQGSAAPEAK